MFQYVRFRRLLGLEGRSPKWPAVEKQFLKDNPRCAVCGTTKLVIGHHKIPFHVDPSKELDITNLKTLCEGPANHHLMFGHLMNWSSYNPAVDSDSSVFLQKIKDRPK